MAHTFEVSVEEQEDGPGDELRQRFAQCASRRLGILERDDGTYPTPGFCFNILDAFAGKFVWEMSDEEVSAAPMTFVDLEVTSVEPETPPADGEVRVTVRVDM
ncbi:MAG: hypothetical protein K8R99_05370 [Actinomycetia bacterium]|nr:hypothetical protein [Actinomycetes bacterium]